MKLSSDLCTCAVACIHHTLTHYIHRGGKREGGREGRTERGEKREEGEGEIEEKFK